MSNCNKRKRSLAGLGNGDSGSGSRTSSSTVVEKKARFLPENIERIKLMWSRVIPMLIQHKIPILCKLTFTLHETKDGRRGDRISTRYIYRKRFCVVTKALDNNNQLQLCVPVNIASSHDETCRLAPFSATYESYRGTGRSQSQTKVKKVSDAIQLDLSVVAEAVMEFFAFEELQKVGLTKDTAGIVQSYLAVKRVDIHFGQEFRAITTPRILW
jgi:hypothetical protein